MHKVPQLTNDRARIQAQADGQESLLLTNSTTLDVFITQRRKSKDLKNALQIMEQGKSLSRKIALITLIEPWSFIRQIQVLETQRTEGACPGWSRLLSQRRKTPIFKALLFCCFLTLSKWSVRVTEIIFLVAEVSGFEGG